jgi:hypothetical protein
MRASWGYSLGGGAPLVADRAAGAGRSASDCVGRRARRLRQDDAAVDISAIKPWAKLLMMTEAVVSLGIAGLVIARAINILA